MPELPEVETVARSLRPRLVGCTVERVETSGFALRHPVDKAAIARATRGATFESVERLGKYLVLSLDGEHQLLVHLGMSGQLLFFPSTRAPLAHTHVVLHLAGGDELRYVDPRRFGVFRPYRKSELAASPELDALGVDPLGASFTAQFLVAELATSRRDVKQFLLEQHRIAGLGNIYVCEALYHSGISPRRIAEGVGSRRAVRLHQAIREVLLAAVEHRGTSLSDYVDADGVIGGNQHHLAVYGREGAPCHACRTPIRRIVQGARSTFYCPRCQR